MRKDKYEIVKELGEGAAGCVYLVKDLHVNRLAAMKQMSRISEIRKELELLKSLKHPGLPEVYDYFEEEQMGFLIMEYVDGITLKKYLEQHGTVPLQLAVSWMKELADILSYLHEQRPPVIYRDLKPSNIMIMENGKLRLIDLGGAFLRSHNCEEDKISIGTPGYSAPEQWSGIHVDEQCDVYSFGAVFHELLTGVSPLKPPYERRPIRQYNRMLPVALENLIRQCTEENPKDRYRGMGQVKEELENCLKRKRGFREGQRGKRFLFGGMLAAVLGTIVIPLLQGVPEESFPDPFLRTPVFSCGLLLLAYVVLFHKEQQKRLLHQEKEIWLTEKRGLGLLVFVAFVLGMAGGICVSQVPVLQAAEKEEPLWVEIKDEENRLLLLKDGAVLPVGQRLRLEVPMDRVASRTLSFQLIATDQKGGVFSSKIFKVQSGCGSE